MVLNCVFISEMHYIACWIKHLSLTQCSVINLEFECIAVAYVPDNTCVW